MHEAIIDNRPLAQPDTELGKLAVAPHIGCVYSFLNLTYSLNTRIKSGSTSHLRKLQLDEVRALSHDGRQD